MTALLVVGVLLLGVAVALVSRAMIVTRLRAADTLVQIGRYGFAGAADQERPEGSGVPRLGRRGARRVSSSTS